MARLRSDFWVSAYIRRCNLENLPAVLRRRGSAEAGAIFIKVDRLDGTGDLYGPAPQAEISIDYSDDRTFSKILKNESVISIEERVNREVKFDSDLWLVEVDSSSGECFIFISE